MLYGHRSLRATHRKLTISIGTLGAGMLGAGMLGVGMLALGAPSASAQTTTCNGTVAIPVPVIRLVLPGSLVFLPDLSDHSDVTPLDNPLPAGTYTPTAASRDLVHPQLPDQLYEQWLAVFFSADGTEVGRTSVTPDLPNSETAAAWDLSTLTLTGTAASVQYRHSEVVYPPGIIGTAESVEPTCLMLTPSGAAVTTSTSTTSTSTTSTSTTLVTVGGTVAANPPAYPYTAPSTSVATVVRADAPTVTPPAPTSAAPTPTTPATSTVVPSVVVVPTPTAQVLGTAVDRPLALTGNDSVPLGVMGFILVAGGSVLLVGGSRRRILMRRR